MDRTLLEGAFHELRSAQRVLVISHVRPDGDAVGSLIGLGLSLEELGTEVQMVLSDGLPVIFRHLPGTDQIRKQAAGDFDMTVVLDCSDLKRTGEVLINQPLPDINLDHHPTNTEFARYNFVDETAVATAEMLADFLPKFGFPITSQVAGALLFGMITDTLGFRTFNMTPKAMRTAAKLMEAGGDLPGLYQRGLLNRTFEAARFWGAGLSNLEREGKIVWTSLTLEDRRVVRYPGRDDADLINFLTTIEGTDIVIMFVEQGHGEVKVSWRSQPAYDISQVASYFKGGGHAAAAGAIIKGDLMDIKVNVIAQTKTMLGFG
jgi:phosphoesterase RecJ-like protein